MVEEDDIRFENMMYFKNILREDDSSTESAGVGEKEYDSLYAELIEKCKPSNFLSDQNKFNMANDIYSQLLRTSDREEKQVLEMRNVAIKELGVRIVFNTKELYGYLEEMLSPRTYERLQPYDAERVRQAGKLYFRLKSLNKQNILELEQLKADVQPFIEIREAELRIEQEEQRRRQEEEKQKQKLKQQEKDKDTDNVMIFFTVLIFIGIIIAYLVAHKII